MDALREELLQWLAEEREALGRHIEANREAHAQHESRNRGNPLLQNFIEAADRLDEQRQQIETMITELASAR